MKFINKKSGVTLIEIMLYFAIVSVVLISVSDFSVRLLTTSQKSTSYNEIRANVVSVTQRMSDSIRSAESLNLDDSVFDLTEGKISINVPDAGNSPEMFWLEDNNVFFQQASGDPIQMNSERIACTKLKFGRISAEKTPDQIIINIRCRAAGESASNALSAIAIETSVSMRKEAEAITTMTEEELALEEEQNICYYAGDTITYNDFSTIENTSLAAGQIDIGRYVQTVGDVKSLGDVDIEYSAYIDGDVAAGGTISKQSNVVITGTQTQGASLTDIGLVQYDVDTNSDDVDISSWGWHWWWGSCDETLEPGTYGDVYVGNNCTVRMSGGEYDVNEFYVNSDAKVVIEDTTNLNVDSYFYFGGYSRVTNITDPFDFNVYTNQNSSISINSSSSFVGNITAPTADVTVSSSANYDGCIHSENITFGSYSSGSGHSYPWWHNWLRCWWYGNCSHHHHH